MSKLILGFAALTLIALVCLPAVAAGPVTYSTDLVGSGSTNLGIVHLDAQATFDENSNLWTYTYVADISLITQPYVTGFTLGNLSSLPFINASHSTAQPPTTPFTDPVYSPGAQSIFWQSGKVYKEQAPITFTFQSAYMPRVDALQDVTMLKGTYKSYGRTIGPTPEPATLASLAVCGMGGLGSFLLRRRAKR